MMINLADDFSAYPSGRDENDGRFNGKSFRRDVLIPAIRKILSGNNSDREIIVDIDGVRAFGSSFLEEAFGGIAREPASELVAALKHVKIKCTKPHLKIYRDAIENYIDEAMKSSAGKTA